ncbi:DMT family transporter [Paludibacterium yongneupense]|uniref:DMT family transporter n=1 Tax=Paludibacterium yongneupense TaxID=400061 RepID=UPI00146E0309|nr:DMT family transporter [Paludibacterium yongneupense]
MQDAAPDVPGTDRAVASRHTPATRSTQTAGLIYGALAVLGWSVFNVSTKASLAHGFSPDDLTLLRFGIAGLFSLPLLCRAGISTAAGLGWKRAFILALCAGPLFGQLVNMAMPVTPLAHAAIMVPAVAMLGGMLLGHFVLADPVSVRRWIGAAIMGGGLLCLMLQGSQGATHRSAGYGDMLFVGAGLLWTAYTCLLKRWDADPVASVAAVNLISGITVLPVYLVAHHGRFPEVDTSWLVATGFFQGVLAALLTVCCYVQSVRLLGASRAAILPAMVPPVALILGAIVLGDRPGLLEIAAVAVALIGFVGALGVRYARQTDPAKISGA